jgi:outer membrane protein assembly factor BamD (BamD/ComL family)
MLQWAIQHIFGKATDINNFFVRVQKWIALVNRRQKILMSLSSHGADLAGEKFKWVKPIRNT